MRLSKRFGLGTIFASLVLATFLILGSKALAAGPNLNLEFGDTSGKTIVGKYNNQKFTFQLNSQYSNGVSTIYQISSSNAGPICSGSLIQVQTNVANHPAATTASQPGGKIGDLKYKPAGSNSCTVYPDLQLPVSAPGAPTSGAGSTSSAKTQIDWSQATGKLNSDGSQLVVTFPDNTTITLKDKNAGDSTINFKPTSDSVGLIDGVTINSWCSDNTAYGAGDKSYGITLSSYTATTGTVKVCYDNGGTTTVTQPSGNGTITIPVNTSAYVPPNAGSGNTTSNPCEDNPWTLSWLACPVLEGVDSLVNDLDGFIQDQLNFNTSDNLNTNVHQLWIAIRDISSIFLIIIMLVMVIAQALGGLGGLDAYTVRKILPKIIIAVIFAQVSWPLLNSVINIANDAGKGIADIMYFPFNGPSQMGLKPLVLHLGYGAPSAITGLALFAGFLVTVMNPFGVLIFALAVVMAVLTAVATLMFRTALIIGCVAFFPLFIMAWILPGTKKYWDMWRSNFSKALMMFPLIMAMIALGRIFAWISGNTGGHTGPFDAIAVLVGYFGPYFFIPKAFKWGGSLLSQANSAISGATSKIHEKPKKYLETGKERLNHFREEQSAQRVYQGRAKWYLGDQFKSGQWDPRYLVGTGKTARRQRRNAQKAAYVATGKKAAREEVENISTLINAATENMSKSQTDDYLWHEFEHAEHDPSAGAERYAIVAKMTQLKNVGQLMDIRDRLSNSEAGRREWNSMVQGNYDGLKAIAPYLAQGFDDLTPGGAMPNDLGGFQGASDEVLSGMTARAWQHYASVAPPAEVKAAFERVYANTSLRGRIDANAAGRLAAAGINVNLTGTAVATTPTPAEIKIQHRGTITANLPPAAVLAAGAPGAVAARQALKVQLQNSPELRQSLAHGIAYGEAAPEHIQVLESIKADAHAVITNPASTPDEVQRARDGWNSVVTQIQQAHQQKLEEAVRHAVSTGIDPATARTAAMGAMDPLTHHTVAEDITELENVGAGPLSKL